MLLLAAIRILKTATENYNTVYNRYLPLHNKATELKGTLDYSLSKLGEDINLAFETLKKAHKVLLQAEPHTIPITGPRVAQVAFDGTPKAALLLSSYSSLSSIAGGAGVGSATAVGSWSFVSLVGSASTGTAIRTLSGVAAKNATLAWFGGGSLATGGAGMAGGSLVLGGLTIVPIIIFTTWSSYTKATKIVEETVKLEETSRELDVVIVTLYEHQNLVSEQRTRLNTAHVKLSAQLAETNNTLFPHGKLSKLWRKFRSLFGQAYYRESETPLLLALDQKLNQLTSCFQTTPDASVR